MTDKCVSHSYSARRGAFAQAIEACEELIRDFEAHKDHDGTVNGTDFNFLEIEALKTAIVRIQCIEARESPPTGPLGRIELGCPGHLIVASRCHWKRHTQVGNYRISSIGDYHPDGDRGKRDTIGGGAESFFETMVFKTTDEQEKDNEGCGCHRIEEWSEIDGERYATAGEAQAGHERYVAKYMGQIATPSPIEKEKPCS